MDLLEPFVREVKALGSGQRGRYLGIISLGYGLLIGSRMIYPVLLPYLRTAFDLSLTAAGLLVSVLGIVGAIGQLPAGLFADRYSERSVMALSLVLVGSAYGVIVLAPSTLVLFGATALVGVGISQYPIARITFISALYRDRIGSAIGVTMAAGDLGQTLVPPLAGVIAAAIAWQVGFGFVIPLFAIVALLVVVILPSGSSEQQTDESLSLDTVRTLVVELRNPGMILTTIVLFLYIFVWQAFTGFYPTYLVEVKGLSSSVAGLLFGLFFALGVPVKPLAGSAFDRLGLNRSLLLVLGGPLVGFLMLPSIQGFWPLVATIAVLSTVLGSGAITQGFLADSLARDVRGTGLGVIRGTSALFGATGPFVFGGLADRGYFDEGYLMLGGLLAAAIVLVTLSSKFRKPAL